MRLLKSKAQKPSQTIPSFLLLSTSICSCFFQNNFHYLFSLCKYIEHIQDLSSRSLPPFWLLKGFSVQHSTSKILKHHASTSFSFFLNTLHFMAYNFKSLHILLGSIHLFFWSPTYLGNASQILSAHVTPFLQDGF